MTPEQLDAIKTDILGNSDPIIVQAVADGNAGAITDWYNEDAMYWIYRNYVEPSEIREVIDVQDMVNITDTDRSRVDSILSLRSEVSAGGGTIGFSGANDRDRSAWDDVFSAASGDNSQQAVAALWQRLSTNAEKVFALSTGNGASESSPDTTSWQGQLTDNDVSDALNR